MILNVEKIRLAALKFADEADDLISNLTGESVSSNQPEESNNSSISSSNPISQADDVYKIPVRVGKMGKGFGEGDKPWVVGTFLPNQYVNETHQQGHNGIDLKATAGTPIYAIGTGKVISVDSGGAKSGNSVKIAHEGGVLTSFYAHLQSSNVQVGQNVDSNTVIGQMGSSGNAKFAGAHLHYETKINGNYIDPNSIIGKIIGSFSQKIAVLKEIQKLIRKNGA